jgi:hypothetical protein
MGYAHLWIDKLQAKGRQMKKLLLMILGFAIMSLILAVLYRSANNAELPDDEWFEFENLPS